jgi:hypothetical protein
VLRERKTERQREKKKGKNILVSNTGFEVTIGWLEKQAPKVAGKMQIGEIKDLTVP